MNILFENLWNALKKTKLSVKAMRIIRLHNYALVATDWEIVGTGADKIIVIITIKSCIVKNDYVLVFRK